MNVEMLSASLKKAEGIINRLRAERDDLKNKTKDLKENLDEIKAELREKEQLLEEKKQHVCPEDPSLIQGQKLVEEEEEDGDSQSDHEPIMCVVQLSDSPTQQSDY